MSGKAITLKQVKLFMKLRIGRNTQQQASAKTGISERSGRRIDTDAGGYWHWKGSTLGGIGARVERPFLLLREPFDVFEVSQRLQAVPVVLREHRLRTATRR